MGTDDGVVGEKLGEQIAALDYELGAAAEYRTSSSCEKRKHSIRS